MCLTFNNVYLPYFIYCWYGQWQKNRCDHKMEMWKFYAFDVRDLIKFKWKKPPRISVRTFLVSENNLHNEWTRLWAERKIKFFGENFYKEKLKLCNLVIIFRPCLTYHPDLSLNIFKPLNFIIIKNLLSTNRKTNKNLMGGAKLWKISQKAGQDERYKKASTLLNWKKNSWNFHAEATRNCVNINWI